MLFRSKTYIKKPLHGVSDLENLLKDNKITSRNIDNSRAEANENKIVEENNLKKKNIFQKKQKKIVYAIVICIYLIFI